MSRRILTLNQGKIKASLADDEYVEAIAFESMNAGDFVKLFYDGADLKARHAKAYSMLYLCNGFIKDPILAGNVVKVYFRGVNNKLSGLTMGSFYYLSDVAGQLKNKAPDTSGYVCQQLGRAISATELEITIMDGIELID